MSHCQGQITKTTPTTENWLQIIKGIKFPLTDYDKSRILLGHLKRYGSVIVKIGDSSEILNEYEKSKILHKIKGFVKYICFFECKDDFRSVPSHDRNYICDGVGDTMKVILMPYFSLGSMAQYKWNSDNLHILKSCLKHSLVSYLTAFYGMNLIHNDFHAGNILLKATKQARIIYDIPEVGSYTLPTHGIRPWIMDFEKMDYANYSSSYNKIISLNNFYFDINNRLFGYLPGSIKNFNMVTVLPISMYLNSLQMKSVAIKKLELDRVFQLIDRIEFLETFS